MPRIMLNILANQAELSPAYMEVRRSQQKDSVCSHEDSGSPRGRRWQTDRVTLCGRQQDKDVTQA